jgi:hypothetical protein
MQHHYIALIISVLIVCNHAQIDGTSNHELMELMRQGIRFGHQQQPHRNVFPGGEMPFDFNLRDRNLRIVNPSKTILIGRSAVEQEHQLIKQAQLRHSAGSSVIGFSRIRRFVRRD